MSFSIAKARKPRKDAWYTRDEINVISKYKREYQEQTTRELQAHVFKTKILVDLFNFWLEQGKAPSSDDESTAQIKVGIYSVMSNE